MNACDVLIGTPAKGVVVIGDPVCGEVPQATGLTAYIFNLARRAGLTPLAIGIINPEGGEGFWKPLMVQATDGYHYLASYDNGAAYVSYVEGVKNSAGNIITREYGMADERDLEAYTPIEINDAETVHIVEVGNDEKPDLVAFSV